MATIPTPPNTSAQTTHALIIRAGGQVIGAINEFNDNMSRGTTPLYELGNVTGKYSTEGPHATVSGNPFEIIPGNISNTTISIQRYEIYLEPFETVFGTPDLTMLSMQLVAIDIEEAWVTFDATGNYRNSYRGCWFSDRGRNKSATSDRVVNTNATVQYTSKLRLLAT